MVWYVLSACSNIGLETPLNNWSTVIPENYEIIDTDEQLYKYLRTKWLLIGNGENFGNAVMKMGDKNKDHNKAHIQFWAKDKKGNWQIETLGAELSIADIIAFEDHIGETITGAKPDKLTETNFYGNAECCKIALWKADSATIPKLHKQDVERLFN